MNSQGNPSEEEIYRQAKKRVEAKKGGEGTGEWEKKEIEKEVEKLSKR